MKTDLCLTDSVHDYKIKPDATRLKMNKIKRYAIENEMRLHFALGAIVILVVIIIVMYGLSICTNWIGRVNI